MLLDAHSHLDMYGNRLESALEETRRHSIFTISNSVDLPSYQKNLEIARRCDLVLPVFGVHPWYAHEYVDRLQELNQATERSPLLGEIGLDYHFVEDASRYPAQRKVFEFFLAAARRQDKAVILHTPGAEEDVSRLLTDYNVQRAIVHWYSGPLDVFRNMVSRRLYFTVGVEVLHSEHIQAIARELPLAQLLTETDNPGGAKWVGGSPGMPRLLLDVIQAVAELKKTTAEVIIRTVRDNFLRLIRDDPWLSDVRARLLAQQRNSA